MFLVFQWRRTSKKTSAERSEADQNRLALRHLCYPLLPLTGSKMTSNCVFSDRRADPLLWEEPQLYRSGWCRHHAQQMQTKAEIVHSSGLCCRQAICKTASCIRINAANTRTSAACSLSNMLLPRWWWMKPTHPGNRAGPPWPWSQMLWGAQ